jgi:hypothetical protein
VWGLLSDLLRLSRSTLRSRSHLAAENLFLRKQLACYVERQVRPNRPDNATRITLALLTRTCHGVTDQPAAGRRNRGRGCSATTRARSSPGLLCGRHRDVPAVVRLRHAVNGERRSFALLRPIADISAQERIRELVLQAYAEHEESATVTQ